ncbi:ADP-ribose pyrophosphatase [Sphingomonas antarctica]|uniref:NUDIX hydrolase n=1 Tax=Sphingomonas antarctica TaxID=2040274 RepID=UPI0039ED3CC5
MSRETVWQGRYIAAMRDGSWEWAARARNIGAAVILAVDDGHVLLVEQFRVPLNARTIELPAGLVGDETAGETIESAAIKELREETGWIAGNVERLGTFASSPGMVSETFELLRATGLQDSGDAPEDGIVLHRVALADVPAFLSRKRDEGLVVDVKLLALLTFV